MPKLKVLVSSCLLGKPCRYDARSKPSAELLKLADLNSDQVEIVSVCPEMLGGLSCPRAPCEIQDKTGKVINSNGEDKTANYEEGARQALALCKANDIKVAILKESSPSCGSQVIYDGTFSGKKIKGAGVTTNLLMHNDVSVFNENQTEQAFQKVLQK